MTVLGFKVNKHGGPSICKSCVCMHEVCFFYLFLYVLQQEGGGSQIVHWDVKEALDLFLMEVHGDQVGETYTDVVSFTDSLCMYVKRSINNMLESMMLQANRNILEINTCV